MYNSLGEFLALKCDLLFYKEQERTEKERKGNERKEKEKKKRKSADTEYSKLLNMLDYVIW